jgi:hypothetical protein
MTDDAPEWVWFNPNSSNPPTPNGANGTAVHLGNHTPSEVIPTLCNQPCLIFLPPAAQATLRDMNGHVVREFQSAAISINGYAAGLYLLTTEATAGTTTHKILLR